jgi:hypothetical protein
VVVAAGRDSCFLGDDLADAEAATAAWVTWSRLYVQPPIGVGAAASCTALGHRSPSQVKPSSSSMRGLLSKESPIANR